MFCVRSHFLLPIVITAALALGSCAEALAEKFTPACENPSLPGNAVAIDRRCGTQGAGGKEAEQNRVKNDYCATGFPTTLTFDQLKELQTEVEQNKGINFGDRANKGSHGPTTDRAPLKALGEGTLVQLRAYVLTAKQEQSESVNCGDTFDKEEKKNLFHDIHISLVETEELTRPKNKSEAVTNECQGIVVEMPPHYRPPEWTAANVNKVARAHLPVRVTGNFFFDSSHVPCADDKPVRSNPKRISLWEIHPIYKFEICTADCDGEGTRLPLEDWISKAK